MKKYLLTILILSSIFTMASCSGQKVVITNDITTNKSGTSEEPAVEKIIDDDVEIDESKEIENTTVNISGHYSAPQSLENIDTLILESEASGEYIEVVIDGKIYEFEYLSLIWDSEENILVEDKLINYFDELKNQVIVIKTYMPEGIPFEMIRWKSSSGKVYEYIISENGGKLGEEGNRYYIELE